MCQCGGRDGDSVEVETCVCVCVCVCKRRDVGPVWRERWVHAGRFRQGVEGEMSMCVYVCGKIGFVCMCACPCVCRDLGVSVGWTGGEGDDRGRDGWVASPTR